jgi:NADH/NAD ratio-sensing transcriptional regulator Rex
MKEDNILMFDTIKRAYGREFKLIHILMINNMESALEKARKEVMFLTMSSHEELEAAV